MPIKVAAGIAAAVLLASTADASVIVLGNYRTGEVVIQGNMPDGSEVQRAVSLAKGGTDAGWTQIWGPDDDKPGWGAVLCVRHSKGVFFAETISQPSETEAMRIVNMTADRFLTRLLGREEGDLIEKSATWPEFARQAAETGVGTKVECAPTWNNQGQKIEFVGKPLVGGDSAEEAAPAVEVKELDPATTQQSPAQEAPPAGDEVQAAVAPPPAPGRDHDAEYEEKMRLWEQQQSDYQRQLAEFEAEKRQIELRQAAQAEQARAALAEHERKQAEHAAAVAAVAEEARRREIEYQDTLSAAQGKRRRGDGPVVIWPEGVVVCMLDPENGQSKFGNWSCWGPGNYSLAALKGGDTFDEKGIRNACGGGSNGREVRDLGSAGGYRVFGCGFGINPDSRLRDVPGHYDPAATRFAVGPVTGRRGFQCPEKQSGACFTPAD